MGSLFSELKRRNVFKVGIAYLALGWVVIQVTDIAVPALNLPDVLNSIVVYLGIIGFPFALFFAWAFELTPDGVKKTNEVDADVSIATSTGRKLDFFIIGALVLIIGGMAYKGTFSATEKITKQSEPAETAELAKTVAVLPFVNMSSDKDQEWFSDGLTEEILNSLAMLPELQVTARTSSFYFKGKNIPIPEIAEKLDVTYVVEGSVRRGGDTLRITVQLIRAKDDHHLWTNTYDKPTSDVLNVQRDVAEKIAEALDVLLDEKRSAMMFASGTRNIEAFETFHKGNAISYAVHDQVTDKNLWHANVFYAQAIIADPKFAAAHNNLQDAYSHFLEGGSGQIFLKNGEPAGLTEAAALETLRYHQSRAIELAHSPDHKLAYQLSTTMQSDDWRTIPQLLKRIKEDPQAIRKVAGTSWFIESMTVLGERELVLPLIKAQVNRNPYSSLNWHYLMDYDLAHGNYENYALHREAAAKYGIPVVGYQDNNYKSKTNPDALEDKYRQLMTRGETISTTLLILTGRTEEAIQRLSNVNLLTDTDLGHIFLYHLLGDSDKANAIAGNIDNKPLGVMSFARTLEIHGVYPFTKQATPNLVRKLRQAGLSEVKINSMFLEETAT